MAPVVRAALALSVAATTSIPGFAPASVAIVTADDVKLCGPSAVAASSVATMTVAASGPVFVVAIAAFVAAPISHSAFGGGWW